LLVQVSGKMMVHGGCHKWGGCCLGQLRSVTDPSYLGTQPIGWNYGSWEIVSCCPLWAWALAYPLWSHSFFDSQRRPCELSNKEPYDGLRVVHSHGAAHDHVNFVEDLMNVCHEIHFRWLYLGQSLHFEQKCAINRGNNIVNVELQLKSLTIFMKIWRWYAPNVIPESYLKTYDDTKVCEFLSCNYEGS
jgi:hypothetical protein